MEGPLIFSNTTPPHRPAAAGTVYLVGAGPGDPNLLTLRGASLLAQAGVVVYDHLVAQAILDMVPAGVERIYAGKQRGNHALPQDQLNLLLVAQAQAGKVVVRLKGGDPFIFGRGGEEVEILAQHRVPFEIVPGVTAAVGVAAYAGIPLTHRNYSQACVFVTGHLKDGSMALDWTGLARRHQTVVVYMVIVPRAYGSQCGAPEPNQRAARKTPPQSGTVAASGSTSTRCG